MKHLNISKTCRNCLQETKVVFVDLNLLNNNGRKIKFNRCKRKNFCFTLVFDRISINIEKLKW